MDLVTLTQVRICFIRQRLDNRVVHWILFMGRSGRVLGLVVKVSRRDLLYFMLM
jgi:hypothetical protein